MFGLEQHLLAGRRQQELDEGLGARLVRRVGDDADVGRHERRHRRIDELHREARALRREAEEVDHDAEAVLAGLTASGTPNERSVTCAQVAARSP